MRLSNGLLAVLDIDAAGGLCVEAAALEVVETFGLAGGRRGDEVDVFDGCHFAFANHAHFNAAGRLRAFGVDDGLTVFGGQIPALRTECALRMIQHALGHGVVIAGIQIAGAYGSISAVEIIKRTALKSSTTFKSVSDEASARRSSAMLC